MAGQLRLVGLYLGDDLLTVGADTGLREHQGEDWPVPCDKDPDGLPSEWNPGAAVATLRRVGWLDQRGRVWLRIPPVATAERERCGSFTPLLIDVRGG